MLTAAMAAVALVLSLWTQLRFASLPNLLPLTAAVLAVDFACRFAPPTPTVRAVQTILYGILYLAITCFCGILAAYAAQRFALPLWDHRLEQADLALGVNWLDFVRWVDDRPMVHLVLMLAYRTMSAQIALPVIVLAFFASSDDVKKYLLSFVIALSVTITISSLMPAAGPIAQIDLSSFQVMRFTGATPVDHLTLLRSAGPVEISDGLAGIATFPSFHATVAVLVPLTLRRYRALFLALVVLDAAMLISTITEGAHYAVDILGGTCITFLAYGLANRIVDAGERRRLALAAAH